MQDLTNGRIFKVKNGHYWQVLKLTCHCKPHKPTIMCISESQKSTDRYLMKLQIMLVNIQTSPSTFKALLVKLVIGCERFLIANIYRPPGITIVTFLDDLSDVEEFLPPAGGHPILLDDCNCSGALPSEIDDWLNTWLSCLHLVVVNDGATCIHGDGSDEQVRPYHRA